MFDRSFHGIKAAGSCDNRDWSCGDATWLLVGRGTCRGFNGPHVPNSIPKEDCIMYTAVMMMALNSGTEVVDFRHRCRGGCCYGGCYSSCWGGYYGGCCGGCCGGYYSGGCCGGYYSGGCCGGYYSGSCYGGYYSGGNYYGNPPGGQLPRKENLAPPKKTEQQAMLIVNLPAQARLIVDDYVTKGTAGQRLFQTPPLAAGNTYAYVLRAEIEREGRTVSQTQRVIVRAGEQTRVSFDFGAPDIAAASPNR
jgi:uncharacterized protein (TIGR03000 family)